MSRSVDFALVEAAKKNPAHFAPLYDKYFEQIFIYIIKKTQNEELTGDLTSQVFLKAILNISKYEDRGYPFSSWLYKIASNEVNLHFRKTNKTNEVEIKEKDMHLIELRYFEGLSFKEIGDILQISHGAAKIKLYRSLEKLKMIFNSN